MGIKGTLSKILFGIVIVVGTLFLWSFPTGQVWLFLLVCIAIGGYALYKTQFGRKSETKIKSVQEMPNDQNKVPPPSYVCPSCHKALTFLKEYNKWYCFSCRQYDEQ